MAELHIKGLSDLQRFLDRLPAKLESNVMRGALRAGSQRELLPEAQANLLAAGAVKSGALIAGLKVGTRVRGGTVASYVRASGQHGYVARWIEYGVRPHRIAARNGGLLAFGGVFANEVSHPGFAPRPFLRPALDRSGAAAVIAAAHYMKDRLATKEGLDTADVVLGSDES
jgi:hypothetical protein